MQPQEKKYRVNSLAPILEIIRQKNLPHIKYVRSTHYYGEHTGNDVEKFVEYPDRIEVHVLKESGGTFTLVDHFPLSSKEEGFAWLKNKGYTTANIITMEYDEYEYDGGLIGTYLIDGFLPSVILYYPGGKHEPVAALFGLTDAPRIDTPYNKYLASLGKLRSVPIM
jgi:hypothetical protein